MKVEGDHPIKINEKVTLSFKIQKEPGDEKVKEQIIELLLRAYQEQIEKMIFDKK